MAKTNIEWCSTTNADGSISKGMTWNPTTSCDKVSSGCRFCYAEIMHKRLAGMKQPKYSAHPFLGGAHEHEESLFTPFKWSKKQKLVFVNSMSDLFHKDISVEFIAKCYAIMFLNQHLTFQILTKRPDRRKEIFESEEFYEYLWKYCNQYHDKHIKPLESEMYQYVEFLPLEPLPSPLGGGIKGGGGLFPFKNIWEGTSVEDKDNIFRIDLLRETKAHIRFISIEPLIEDLGEINLNGIHQVIVGGESGHKRRAFDTDWARTILKQCQQANVPFFMKQVDKKIPIPKDLFIREFPSDKIPYWVGGQEINHS